MQNKIYFTPLVVTFFILVFSFFVKTQTKYVFLDSNSLNKQTDLEI
jgi:hypothetical protein